MNARRNKSCLPAAWWDRTEGLSRFLVRVLLLLILLLSLRLVGRAQTAASLTVTVHDPSHAAIAHARVTLKSASGEVKKSQTGGDGEAHYLGLALSAYHLQVEARGFTPIDLPVQLLHTGETRVTVAMRLAPIQQRTDVHESRQEAATDARGNAFSMILTPAQIAQLPDDPDELKQALQNMAGTMSGPQAAVIRVDGFEGGDMPPKSEIASIHFQLNPYAAENHGAGGVRIDIETRPGLSNWHGDLDTGFRGTTFDARNAFAEQRTPETYRRFEGSVGGPLWRNHSSFWMSVTDRPIFDSALLHAALPGGVLNGAIDQPSDTWNVQARVDQKLTGTHALHFAWQRTSIDQENLGVGGYDLPSRAWSQQQFENVFRLSAEGPVNASLLNQFHFQTRWQSLAQTSATQAPAVQVLNAFTSGGAQVQADDHLQESELLDDMQWSWGPQIIGIGTRADLGAYRNQDLQNGYGTFTFASLQDYALGRPQLFTRRVGEPLVGFQNNDYAWYLEDDIRLRSSLTVSLGVRQEWQTHITSWNNFAPRAGFSWSPSANGGTVIRGGGGIFYNWLDAGTYSQIELVNGQQQSDINIEQPGYPDPAAGGQAMTLPASRYRLDPQLQQPYLEQGSLGLMQTLGHGMMVHVGGFAQRGVRMLRARNLNAPVAGIRPDPALGNLDQIEADGHALYRAMNLGLSWNTSRLMLMTNYSLSKSMDDNDGPFSLPSNNDNLRADWGPAATDARHRFFSLASWRITPHLQAFSIFHANSAMPYTLTTGLDNNGDTVFNDRPAGVGRNSARGSGAWDLDTRLSWSTGFGGPRRSEGGGPRMLVVGPGPGGPPPSGGAVKGPGGPGMMMGPPGGNESRWNLQFYLQAFNLMNHASFTNYSGVETSPFFGQPTAAMPGRRLEAGARFSF